MTDSAIWGLLDKEYALRASVGLVVNNQGETNRFNWDIELYSSIVGLLAATPAFLW